MKTLIKNGFIADGTGAPGFVGSVTIENDRITGVFRVEEAEFDEGAFDSVYDASGSIVSPGFIDAHSHSDAYLVIEPDAPSKLSQGVTTEINGQCGGSIAPRYAEARLSGDWAEVLGERLNWRSLAEYRETLAQAKPAINTVQFIGHNTLRSSVIGYAGRPAAAEELERMKSLLARTG
jgi:N-acyl-D-amino-acid deacylase